MKAGVLFRKSNLMLKTCKKPQTKGKIASQKYQLI